MVSILTITELGENGSLAPCLEGTSIVLVEGACHTLPWQPIERLLHFLKHAPGRNLEQAVTAFSPLQFSLDGRPGV